MSKMAIFQDTETTGLGRNDKVIEYCGILFLVDGDNYEYMGEYHVFNEVDAVISVGAQRVHGITPTKLTELSHGKSYAEYLQGMYGVLSKASYVFGHNVNFDVRMVTSTYGRVYSPDVQFFDTIDSAKYYFGRNMKLSELAKATLDKFDMPQDAFDKEFNVLYGEGGYHGALYDAYVTARVYMLLNNKVWIYPNT